MQYPAEDSFRCDRPGCYTIAPAGDRYCSDTCYALDNDTNPITAIGRNKVDGFGNALHWMTRTPVHVKRLPMRGRDFAECPLCSRNVFIREGKYGMHKKNPKAFLPSDCPISGTDYAEKEE